VTGFGVISWMVRANEMSNEEAPVKTFVVDENIFDRTTTSAMALVTRDGDIEHEVTV